MTLRQTIQAAPGKTSDLIAKLSETSNQAVKTREGLFAQLSDELTLYVEIEEQTFLPLLQKHDETKMLVPDTLKGNKDLRASLEKLTAMPKDTDAFLAELDVLNKSFQRHIRNERKELLPAILKALSTEEATDLAATIDGSVAEAEKVRRDEKREEVAKAKSDEEKAEAAGKAKREAAKAERDAAKTAEAAKEKREIAKAERAVEKAEQTAASMRAAQKTGERTLPVANDTQEGLALLKQASRTISGDLQAVGNSSTVSASAATNIYAVWMHYVSSAARINTTASQQMMQCKNMRDVAELQTEFASSAFHNMMERNAKFLKIAQEASVKALAPFGARIG